MSLVEIKKQIIEWKKGANSGIAVHCFHQCLELIELEEQKIKEHIRELEDACDCASLENENKLRCEIEVLRGVIGK